jgi:crotonobetainyl-CoA:carnitine CoA-transferase CaiB-like acyl-CoA transferase
VLNRNKRTVCADLRIRDGKWIAISAGAPIYDVAELLADPHIAARGSVVTVDDAELRGQLRMQNVIGALSLTPGEVRHAAPRLGADDLEVLVQELGFSETELGDEGDAR